LEREKLSSRLWKQNDTIQLIFGFVLFQRQKASHFVRCSIDKSVEFDLKLTQRYRWSSQCIFFLSEIFATVFE